MRDNIKILTFDIIKFIYFRLKEFLHFGIQKDQNIRKCKIQQIFE